MGTKPRDTSKTKKQKKPQSPVLRFENNSLTGWPGFCLFSFQKFNSPSMPKGTRTSCVGPNPSSYNWQTNPSFARLTSLLEAVKYKWRRNLQSHIWGEIVKSSDLCSIKHGVQLIKNNGLIKHLSLRIQDLHVHVSISFPWTTVFPKKYSPLIKKSGREFNINMCLLSVWDAIHSS